MAEFGVAGPLAGTWKPPASVEQARARARERFKSRLESGEQVGKCGCGDGDPILGLDDASPPVCVVVVRFRDSGRIYYYRPDRNDLLVGDWIVVPTGRGEEAARIVLAPHQIRKAQIQGELRSVSRRLSDDDVRRMEAHRRRGPEALKAFRDIARARRLGLKPIAADFGFDGTTVTLNFSIPDRERAPEPGVLHDLSREAASALGCRVELRQVGPRDEARLLGGLGRCGRTLCCSSWLPVFPEISMNMAKNQYIPLNPSKVSGVCGRLLCCLSYENDQYRQMKAVMPKLGQPITTPAGDGIVVSLQVLRELVTVRFQGETPDQTYAAVDLGFQPKPEQPRVDQRRQAEFGPEGQPKRRRRRGRNLGPSGQPTTQA